MPALTMAQLKKVQQRKAAARRLLARLEKAGWTATEIGYRIGVSIFTVSRWRGGEFAPTQARLGALKALTGEKPKSRAA